METDFRTVLESIESMGDDDELDEVEVNLLVAAKHEQLLYDISRWGEDAGVASKATFSRTKNHLEEKGLIETEKIPIDVGRPRLRLLLGDERLREAEAEELASVAQSMSSSVEA
jgi:predicted transcriptional regulator